MKPCSSRLFDGGIIGGGIPAPPYNLQIEHNYYEEPLRI
jgi:hypothetical protein